MATQIMTKGMTVSDRFVIWTMMTGLAVAVMQIGQGLALPAHFV